jgi:cytohesin
MCPTSVSSRAKVTTLQGISALSRLRTAIQAIPRERRRVLESACLCVLFGTLGLSFGCNVRSKEQEREIASIEKRVVDNPASVNVDDGSGTPLDVAVINNYLELADWLLDHHADVNARHNNGETPLHRAVIYDRGPDHKMIRFLLRKGADVNAVRRYQETPLHEAASLGLLDAVRILIEHGANVNAPAGRAETPLHLASCPAGYPEVVEFLLLHGANIEAPQNNGATALHQAVLAGNVKVVELLLAKGANPNAKTRAGQTPLHYAAAGGQPEIAERLLARNAWVNASDSEGHTPLWRALHSPAITTSVQKSAPVDTASVAGALRRHGGVE